MNQKLRDLGAKTAVTNLGITMDEVHRLKPSETKWCQRAYPLVINDSGIRYYRTTIQDELKRRGVPYLVTSECDGCPHKDWPRWQRTSPETVAALAEFEARFNGEFFLTRHAVPLPQAIELMKRGESMGLFGNESLDTCDEGFCFV